MFQTRLGRGLASALVLAIASVAARPAHAQAEPYLGQLMLTAASYCPAGWAEANGQLVPISGNPLLFSLLGTTYGGAGGTHFALPDLRGRAPIHYGTGPGLTPRTMGEAGGAETVTLTASQMPVHSHSLLGTTSVADAPSPTNAVLAAKARTKVYRAAATPDTALQGGSITTAGASAPHDNMPPYLVMRWCIAVEGVVPPQPFAASVEAPAPMAPASVQPRSAASEAPPAPQPERLPRTRRRTAR